MNWKTKEEYYHHFLLNCSRSYGKGVLDLVKRVYKRYSNQLRHRHVWNM